MEVSGDLRIPHPPFNPVLLLRLQHLLQHLLSSSSSSSSNCRARASLTRWFCGRSDDPGAFARGAPRLLQQCSSLLQQHVHPVALLLYKRRLLGRISEEGGPPEQHLGGPLSGVPYRDGENLALAIEGGAMRACVSAGMAVCLHYLGFSDTFDAIYGSSAGALIGAFLVSRQLAYEGTCIYTDWLPHLGTGFIDVKRIGRALGLGCLLDWDVMDLVASRLGRPLVNLDTLLIEVLQKRQPFYWREFEKNDRKQPLKIIASGLLSLKSVTLDTSGGHIKDLSSLCECLRASMLLPGMTGPVVHLPLWGLASEGGGPQVAGGGNKPQAATHGPGGPSLGGAPQTPGSSIGGRKERRPRGPLPQFMPVVSSSALPRFAREAPRALVSEPLADALLFEPVPYRSAIGDDATHVLVLRSRPDLARVGRLSGLEAAMEMQMARRFFLRKHNLRPVYEFMRRRGHRELYMRDMLRLNAATNSLDTKISGLSPSATGVDEGGGPQAYAMAVAVGGGEKETHKLKVRRESILSGVRGGFAALWDALQPEPSLRGRGREEALKLFPNDLPLCPTLGGPPGLVPPPYVGEAPLTDHSPADLAEYLMQAVAAVAAEGAPKEREKEPPEDSGVAR